MNDALELPSHLHHLPEVARQLTEQRKRPTLLELDAVGCDFESPSGGVVTALSEVSFCVRKRELISVIGPSGCGKSSLIRVVAGLLSPSRGKVVLKGEEVLGPGADRGMVFQGYTLFPWLTVEQNVMFGPRMKGISRRRSREMAAEWLEVVGLEAARDQYPAQLSGGMKQRVAIARALANDPSILLMDEPFGALDAQTRCSMQAHLLRIWEQVDVTIMFITHDLDEAIYLSDRIVVLGANPGRVLEVIEVPVPRVRGPEQFLSAHFLATKRRLEELIYGEVTLPRAGRAAESRAA
jgi:NitT/TauT family transport system ATP-binding protein